MEYGLWNFHGGFWNGGNGGFPPVEAIPRNFYAAVNSETESPTFHITTHSNGNSNLFSNISGTQPCPSNICTNIEYLSLKHVSPINGRISSVTIPGHPDDILQSVALESVPLTSEIITEQNSMDNFASSDTPIPGLLSQQQNHNSNYSCSGGINNNITSTTTAITTTTITIAAANTSTSTTTINTTSTNTISTTTASTININNNKIGIIDNPSGKGSKNENKIRLTDNEEIWGDINGQGTNIKLENNPTIDYFFQHGYQNPVYEVVFSKISSNNKKEAGTSDETDEEDELEENASQVQAIDNIQNTSHPKQNGSPILQPMPNAATINFSKSGYECGDCGLSLDTRAGLKKHLIFHSNANPDLRLSNSFIKKVSASSKCPMSSCRFRSSERAEMEAHVSRHITGENKLNSMKKTGPLTPQRVRYEREEYRCQICAYSCTVEKAFHKHLKIHSVGRQMNQIKISCVICGKDRSSEVDMNKHMKKHRDDRYFCCDICIFKTVQLKKLIQHRRMHTGEKPHLCPHCSYRSARRDNLRSHVRRVHKKDNLFCDTFSPRSLLVTEDLPNPATMPSTPISSETFTNQTALE